LKDLHEHGIVHRDIKLENLMLTSGQVKIIDFGLCDVVREGTLGIDGMAGSPGYVAPEVYSGRPYGTKSDVFGVGVVLYALVGGKLPFHSRTVKETVRKNANCALFFPERRFYQVPTFVIKFLEDLMQADPTQRYTAE
jgi:serine/threonine protein kinase